MLRVKYYNMLYLVLYSIKDLQPAHNAEQGIDDLKLLLEKSIPLILAHNGSFNHHMFGTTHMIKLDTSVGLKCELLQGNELSTPSFNLLEKLQRSSFTKVRYLLILAIL